MFSARSLGSWILATAVFSNPVHGEYRLTMDGKTTIRFTDQENEALERAEKWEDTYAFAEAIDAYQALIKTIAPTNKDLQAYCNYRLAYAQRQAGEMAQAIQTMGRAIRLSPQIKTYARFRSELLRYRNTPDGKERGSRYYANRKKGTAGALQGSNGILHVFVRGRNAEFWEDSDKIQTQLEVARADAWLQRRARAFEVEAPPVFEHRYVEALDQPFLRKLDVPDHATDEKYRETWEAALLPQFHVASYQELFDKVFEGKTFRNRAIAFHANGKGRAFAISVRQGKYADLETAYVLFNVRRIADFAHGVTYAHELLHLYGADDLYNKVDEEPMVKDTEVMKFGGYCLDATDLCPLTAYAVAWTDEMPFTRFIKVVTPY